MLSKTQCTHEFFKFIIDDLTQDVNPRVRRASVIKIVLSSTLHIRSDHDGVLSDNSVISS